MLAPEQKTASKHLDDLESEAVLAYFRLRQFLQPTELRLCARWTWRFT
jgi:hypothetical protein